jgi:hypothetical protein
MVEEIVLEIFGITAEMSSVHFDNLGAQREFCQRVVELFARPPWVAKCALRQIILQLESCGYECEGVRLEMNTAFVALKELADEGAI